MPNRMRRPRNRNKKPSSAPRLQGGGANLSGNKFKLPRGVYYDSHFLSAQNKAEILKWLSGIFPIWEMRYSAHNPPPDGQSQRSLLRPVYWLGNWQFACLDYYHPPKNVENCCVEAEPFPHCLQYLVQQMEDIVRETFETRDIPRGWHLNTCLINYYGHKIEGDKKIDTARVGEHRDFEPGPVASLSLGERAFFQFVSSRKIGSRDSVAFEQWLDDSSLQIFGGHRFKSELFHRVQRVEKKNNSVWRFNVADFETRRINFTFRYVPDEHVIAYSQLPSEKAEDIRPYLQKLAEKSEFFKMALS
ncbi:MAG: alpha-ketoglutarate-dependent dioxygenase AlkB, partial [Pseudobdellovibrionaceae bacterium]